MRIVVLTFLIITSFLTLKANSRQQTELKALTESPVLFEKRTLLTPLMTEAEYRRATSQLAKSSNFPSINRKPSTLTANARFGFNLNFGGFHRSWIVDGDETSGYVLYADLNANGDLTDDSPLKFQNSNGKYSLLYQTNVREGAEVYPYQVKLEITTDTEPEQSMAKLSMAFYNNTVRRGKIKVGGCEVAFGLVGVSGFYNSKTHLIFFDINGDGRFETETAESAERYTVSEKYVNFAGVTYQYDVERFGKSLTLKPLTEKLPERESLSVGNPAPDFSFTDANSQTRRLSDYRGKVVLLDFWATWCPPCRTEAPKLSAAYQRLHDKGFEIIGINSDVNEIDFKNFVTVHSMTWSHTRENYEEGHLQKLFRADTFPTYYLIDRNGVILASQIKSRDLISEIEKSLND
jgi:peroxiredoxin